MQGTSQPARVVLTKAQPPPYDGGLVARRRLIEVLQAGSTKRLTLIQAPAGYGKTTLAVQWHRVLNADGVRVAWLSLDRDDNHVVTFVGPLIEAGRRAEPTLAVDLGDLLEQDSEGAQRYVLAELVNRIAERERSVAIVLDDWHLIDDPATLE